MSNSPKSLGFRRATDWEVGGRAADSQARSASWAPASPTATTTAGRAGAPAGRAGVEAPRAARPVSPRSGEASAELAWYQAYLPRKSSEEPNGRLVPAPARQAYSHSASVGRRYPVRAR